MAASSGIIIAAALESVGYQAQSQVLEQLSSFFSSLGFMIFLLVGFTALIYQAIRERLDRLLWILIGPVLFFTMLNVRTPAAGVEWQFGDFKGDTAQVEAVVGKSIDANVSWFFHLYNRMISGIFTTVIKVFSDDMIKTQVKFMNRERIMEQLFRQDLGSPGLTALVREGITGSCGSWVEANRRIALGNRDRSYAGSPEHLNAVAALLKDGGRPIKTLSSSSTSYAYLSELLPSMRQVRKITPDGKEAASSPSEFIKTFCEDKQSLKADFDKDLQEVISGPVSCEQLWCWSAMGLYQEAKTAMFKAADDAVAGVPATANLDSEKKAEFARELLADISLKLNPDPQSIPRMPGEPKVVLQDISLIPVMISGAMLQKQVAQNISGPNLTGLASQAGVYVKQFNFDATMPEDDSFNRVTERVQQEQLAAEHQMTTFVVAMTLPYIQGILLYVMALAFPFYCFLLLIPKHATSFFGWLRMWAWLKSWDLGWALVMIVDELLWDMMPHSAAFSFLNDSTHSPITVLDVAFHNDPSYSMAMYYLILSLLILGIPVITGRLLLGREGILFTMLFDGLTKSFAGKLGDAASDVTALRQTFKAEWMRTWAEASAAQQVWRDFAEGKGSVPGLDEVYKDSKARAEFGGRVKAMGAAAGLGGLFLAAPLAAVAAPLGVGAAMVGAGGMGAFKWGVDSERFHHTIERQRRVAGTNIALYQANWNQNRRLANALRGAITGRVMNSTLNDLPDVAGITYGVPADMRGQFAFQDGYAVGSAVRAITTPAGRGRIPLLFLDAKQQVERTTK